MTLLPQLLVLAALSPTAQEDELAFLDMQPVEISVGGGTKTAYRGRLSVPIVRANPDSKRIEIDVWRFPAEGIAAEGWTPVVQLNGGPGWPGLEPSAVDWEGEIAPFVAHGDYLLIGQRGIGTSTDTSCNDFAAPIDADLPPEERAAALRAQCAACRAHWEELGYDLSGFNVIEAARDVDDVRRLLGYEKIALSGGSFGSHWSMAVMRFHPDSVARAVLNGLEGPDHTYDSPAGLLKALESIAATAEASPELAGKLPEEGLIAAFRAVLESVETDPFELEVDGQLVPITADALRDLAFGYTSRVNSRNSIGGWPGDVMRLYEGRFEPAARAIAQRRAGGGGLPTAAFFGLDCGSGITRERLERYLSDPACEVVGNPSWFYEAACPAWDADLGDEFRADFKSSIPTVIVHGKWDVSTPYDNALELRPFFEDLHFIPVEGGTHGALGEATRNDPAFQGAVLAFLFHGETEGLPDSIELPPIRWSTGW